MKILHCKYLKSFLFSAGLATVGTNALAVVVLNEIMVDPIDGDGSTTNSGEWVELFGNSGDDIGGWVISDGDDAITIPAGTVIPADGFYLIGNSTIGGLVPDFDTSGTYSGGATPIPEISLTNGGEFIGLFDVSLSLVDGLIWIENVVGDPNAPSGQAVSLFGGGTLNIPNLTDVVNPPAPWAWINTDGANGESLARSVDGAGAWLAANSLNGPTPGISNLVPEPSTALLLTAGLALGMARRRRQAGSTLLAPPRPL